MWLSIKNISIDWLPKKLDYKMIGYFKVLRKKCILLKLQFSQAIKIYNVFHPNLLWKSSTNILTDQVNKLTLLMIINNGEK